MLRSNKPVTMVIMDGITIIVEVETVTTTMTVEETTVMVVNKNIDRRTVDRDTNKETEITIDTMRMIMKRVREVVPMARVVERIEEIIEIIEELMKEEKSK